MIDLNNIPVEPIITIVDPNGNDVITTNNVTTLFYIRNEIKKNSLKGYKVRTDDGELWDIMSNGKIVAWPENMTGAVFDKLLHDLL